MENIKHSKANMASYGFAKALSQFIGLAFTAFGFYYYESEIGLNVLLVGLGYILYAIYNAVNDPLVGYLSDRPFRFTKRWGRRFPWIIFGGAGWIVSYVLIFMPPNVDPESGAWILLAWLVFASCLFDTFASIFFVNFNSLFPDKFRTIEERRTANAIATPIGLVGTALAVTLPPYFITFGDLRTYIIQAGVVLIIGFLILILSIPGCREDQETIDRYLSAHDNETKRESFFSSMKIALKQKSFVAFIITYVLYQSLVDCVQVSVPYVVRFILEMPASAIILISVGFLIGSVLSIPFWIKMANKTNDNRKTILIAFIFLAVSAAPLIFINSYIGIIIGMTIMGIGIGGTWVMLAIVLGDVIDESIVRTGKREEGIYSGFQQFFGRLAILIQAITFVVIHTLTGFDEGASTQSPEAVFGIHLHFALLPMIYMLIGCIIFWKFYDLTPIKVKANQEKLRELGL
jgi:GPH family glycoside/pentoside/hexuronide:cation symporter